MSVYLINIGSSIAFKTNIPLAVREIKKIYKVTMSSPIFISKPVGIRSFRMFGNLSLLIHTDLNKDDLKLSLISIEHNLGRLKSKFSKTKDRKIDIDIINSIVGEDSYVVVPTMSMHVRVPSRSPLFL